MCIYMVMHSTHLLCKHFYVRLLPLKTPSTVDVPMFRKFHVIEGLNARDQIAKQCCCFA